MKTQQQMHQQHQLSTAAGKALFICAFVVFCLCLALGTVSMDMAAARGSASGLIVADGTLDVAEASDFSGYKQGRGAYSGASNAYYTPSFASSASTSGTLSYTVSDNAMVSACVIDDNDGQSSGPWSSYNNRYRQICSGGS